MKYIAVVDPTDLRYVINCQRCDFPRNRKTFPFMMTMYFKAVRELLQWQTHVRLKKAYWQPLEGYCQCEHVKRDVRLYRRQENMFVG